MITKDRLDEIYMNADANCNTLSNCLAGIASRADNPDCIGQHRRDLNDNALQVADRTLTKLNAMLQDLKDAFGSNEKGEPR
jgi:hypothetical protein